MDELFKRRRSSRCFEEDAIDRDLLGDEEPVDRSLESMTR
jgi:hypothetical protein